MIEYPVAYGGWQSPGGHPLAFAYRTGTNDWNTLTASTTQDEYGLPSGLTGRAVDIGGYLGSVGIALALDNPGLTVTIIEPVPDNAALIRQNIELNDVGDRVTLIEGAASGDHDPVSVWFRYVGTELAEHHAFVGNSTLAYDGGGELDHQEVTYAPITLDDLTADGELALLKIDCEGGEWSILDTAATAKVALILGEAHCVRGHRGRDIVDLLPFHDVTWQGVPDDPEGNGTVEFRAVRR